MQNLITAHQMKEVDEHTIKNQPISSINLMENAAKAFVKAFKKEVPGKETKISILCGQGNNGGDGLAIARLLSAEKYKNVSAYLIKFSDKQSEDNKQNVKRLLKMKVPVTIVRHPETLQALKDDIVIDAILGSGLNKPLTGFYADLVGLVNSSGAQIIAVDIPTGFLAEGELPQSYNGIKADLVICFEQPKFNFFLPESIVALTRFKAVKIGLDKDHIQSLPSNKKLITKSSIKSLIKVRPSFSHKGTFGHALVVAGSVNTIGAAILTANACLHIGAGLTTTCLPESALTAMNIALPEVMTLERNGKLTAKDFDRFNAIGIGPGLGITTENEQLLEIIISLKKPVVLDADALTMLRNQKEMLNKLSSRSILTPHMKEFDRLFGEHKNWFQRLKMAQKQAHERDLIIVLKNQFTFICLPSGEIRINPSGNPAMASGGMGDVLTGIITGLLAQGYSQEDAATLGVYIHGKAGDELSAKLFVVTASQLAQQIPKTLKKLSQI